MAVVPVEHEEEVGNFSQQNALSSIQNQVSGELKSNREVIEPRPGIISWHSAVSAVISRRLDFVLGSSRAISYFSNGRKGAGDDNDLLL